MTNRTETSRAGRPRRDHEQRGAGTAGWEESRPAL